MPARSRGRGVTAAVGWLLLCGGIIGAIALVLVGQRRFENTIDTFARAQVGCATTLRFTDPGTFYVYEETIDPDVATDPVTGVEAGECVPAGIPGSEFSFTLSTGDGVVRTVRDRSITYEQDGRTGESYSTFEVAAPVTVDIAVSGPDTNTVAAVGRNPVEARDEMRRAAVILGVAGVVLGVLLLVLSGRKSRRAGALVLPDGPGWSRPIPPAPPVVWPPSGPSISGVVPTTSQQPINPHMPDGPAGTYEPANPWASPTYELKPMPAAEPLPQRMPAPQAGQADTPEESESVSDPVAPPVPAPPAEATSEVVPEVVPDAVPEVVSEAAHDGDYTPED